MLNIKKTLNLTDLKELKQQYFAQSTAPLDGMWHFGFVPMSNHFSFFERDSLVGYCSVNEERHLLQFYLAPTAKTQSDELFNTLINSENSSVGEVKGAFASTAEPHYFSLCLDNTDTFKVNALMFEENKQAVVKQPAAIEMALAKKDQLNNFIEFAVIAIGAPKEWLATYYGNLIERGELWGYWRDSKIAASGECRLFDELQSNYADLGMIVAPSERGRGLAASVLHFLKEHANNQHLTAICSTESNNISARKAIHKVGFTAKNRIVQFSFN